MAQNMRAESEGSKGGAMEVSSPEESVFRLFEPDLITPEQHRDRVRPECTDQPEVRLMLAVMEDAVATYQRYAVDPGRRNQRLFEEADRCWFAIMPALSQAPVRAPRRRFWRRASGRA